MKITYVELLRLEHSDGSGCTADICLHGNGGERIQMQCSVSKPSGPALNGLLAREAVRQLNRMPEFRRQAAAVSERAMPKLKARRVIRLTRSHGKRA